MKVTLLALLALLSAVAAAPAPSGDTGIERWDHAKDSSSAEYGQGRDHGHGHGGGRYGSDGDGDRGSQGQGKGDDRSAVDAVRGGHNGKDRGDGKGQGDDGKGNERPGQGQGKDRHDAKGKGDDDRYTESGKGSFPFEFTSTAVAYAGPREVVDSDNKPVAGLEEGWGKFAFGLNSEEDVICYNITAWIRGDYSSPAVTATHIHEAGKGRAGPPRIAFPNPKPINGEPLDKFSWRRSVGCLTGPFKTGVDDDKGRDTGKGFSIAELEKNPEGFFADTHTAEFPAGAIRGQLQWH